MASVGTMSNKVLVLDAATDTWAGKLQIDFFHWVGATTAAHALLVKDTAGHTLWAASADGSGDDQTSPQFDDLYVTGIVVTTMGSGKLYIHLR